MKARNIIIASLTSLALLAEAAPALALAPSALRTADASAILRAADDAAAALRSKGVGKSDNKGSSGEKKKKKKSSSSKKKKKGSGSSGSSSTATPAPDPDVSFELDGAKVSNGDGTADTDIIMLVSLEEAETVYLNEDAGELRLSCSDTGWQYEVLLDGTPQAQGNVEGYDVALDPLAFTPDVSMTVHAWRGGTGAYIYVLRDLTAPGLLLEDGTPLDRRASLPVGTTRLTTEVSAYVDIDGEPCEIGEDGSFTVTLAAEGDSHTVDLSDGHGHELTYELFSSEPTGAAEPAAEEAPAAVITLDAARAVLEDGAYRYFDADGNELNEITASFGFDDFSDLSINGEAIPVSALETPDFVHCFCRVMLSVSGGNTVLTTLADRSTYQLPAPSGELVFAIGEKGSATIPYGAEGDAPAEEAEEAEAPEEPAEPEEPEEMEVPDDRELPGAPELPEVPALPESEEPAVLICDIGLAQSAEGRQRVEGSTEPGVDVIVGGLTELDLLADPITYEMLFMNFEKTDADGAFDSEFTALAPGDGLYIRLTKGELTGAYLYLVLDDLTLVDAAAYALAQQAAIEESDHAIYIVSGALLTGEEGARSAFSLALLNKVMDAPEGARTTVICANDEAECLCANTEDRLAAVSAVSNMRFSGSASALADALIRAAEIARESGGARALLVCGEADALPEDADLSALNDAPLRLDIIVVGSAPAPALDALREATGGKLTCVTPDWFLTNGLGDN